MQSKSVTQEEKTIFRAIHRGANTLNEILSNCSGMYPLEVKDLLQQLVDKKVIDVVNTKYVFSEGRGRHDLPSPHPHDFDWRFDLQAKESLSSIIRGNCIYNGKVLLIGTPSIFSYLCSFYPEIEASLIDYNLSLEMSLIESIKETNNTFYCFDLMRGDILEDIVGVDVVLLDPPWYYEYYETFLTQAAYSANMGGMVIVCLLPMNTRPSAIIDRERIIQHAFNVGLHISEIHAETIRYITPSFEKMSLKRFGIEDAPNWRYGDLLLLKKVSELEKEKATKFNEFCKRDDSEWVEFLINDNKIKIRLADDFEASPEIKSIVPHDIMQTVSRRNPDRDKIDMWFWDNRVYGLKGNAAFIEAMADLVKQSNKWPSKVSRDKIEIAKKLLNDIFLEKYGGIYVD